MRLLFFGLFWEKNKNKLEGINLLNKESVRKSSATREEDVEGMRHEGGQGYS